MKSTFRVILCQQFNIDSLQLPVVALNPPTPAPILSSLTARHEPLQIFLHPRTFIMMSILLPNLPTLSELITQVTQNELQILVCLRESLFERRVYIIHSRILGRLSDLLREEIQSCAAVCQIGFSVQGRAR